MRVGILTISDRASSREYDDRSGPLIGHLLEERLGWQVAETGIVPDEIAEIEKILLDWVDVRCLNVVFTTGGTGFAPRDVTPEATRSVIEREAPGLAEAMRAAGLRVTPHAMLSRAVCGIRAQTLVVNLPGSPKAIRENLEVLFPVLPHALDLLNDKPGSESGHRFIRQV
ncbi:MAG: molybdopterin adenylyltransferase [Anaerolineae bacterium]|nr:molybdopterin adenylyltransferase [Anaerolineae bacterium]